MDKPLVSVIMPAYNAALYINEAIESVINQTFRNWELIIVNDGSTDATREIILGFEKKDRRIKYLFQENGKQGKARNLGIAHSIGQYIAFLDADDLWIENKLVIQVNYLISNPEIDLIFSQGYFLNQDNPIDFDVRVKPIWNINDLPLFIEQNQIPILSVVVKKTCLIDVDNFSEDLNIQNVEDYHLWLKLLCNNQKFRSIKQRLFFYRIHDNQITKTEESENIKLLHLFIEFYKYHNNRLSHKMILAKLRWGIFDHLHSKEYFNICYHIATRYNKSVKYMVKLINIIPFKPLRNKLIVRTFRIL